MSKGSPAQTEFSVSEGQVDVSKADEKSRGVCSHAFLVSIASLQANDVHIFFFLSVSLQFNNGTFISILIFFLPLHSVQKTQSSLLIKIFILMKYFIHLLQIDPT